MLSFVGKWRAAEAELAKRSDEHPWKLLLERVQGKADYDGISRVSTHTLPDILEIPQNRRCAGTYRLLAN